MEKFKIIRSDSAENDLKEILMFIALNNSPEVALKILTEFEEAVMQLQLLPFSGSPQKFTYRKKHNYRFLVVENYLVYYHTDDVTKTVYIDRIKHGAMLPQNV